MNTKKLLNVFKITIIIFLVMAIAFVSIIQWKGDIIVTKVIGKLSSQLQDSLHYETVHLEWFNYFPSIALRLDGLTLGPDEVPLIDSGYVDVVLRLFPLFKEKIVINKLMIRNAQLNIIKRKTGWSYDVFKKSDSKAGSGWQALVNQVNVEKSVLVYDDKEGISLKLAIADATVEGLLGDKLLDADIEMNGILSDLISGSYKLPDPFSFALSGNYKRDDSKNRQEFANWNIKNAGIDIEGSGSIDEENNQEFIDAIISWKNGDAQTLKQFFPVTSIKNWEGYTFSGDTKGEIRIKGASSKKITPYITCTSELKNGSINFPGQEETVKDIDLNLTYDNGDLISHKKSFVTASLHKGSYLGNKLNAAFSINDLDHPEMALELNGSLPSSLLNLFSSSQDLVFQNGVFDVDHFTTSGILLDHFSMKSIFEKSNTKFSMDNVKFKYHNDVVEITDGKINLASSGDLDMEANKFTWNNANAEDVKGKFNFVSDKVDYEINGSICQGEIESKGSITSLGERPVMDGDWIMKGVEIKEVMSSFENFDQTFITSDNIKGKTNVWAHVKIPYDESGNIIKNGVSVQSAIHVKDGELKDMKTLEDFSKYVHVDDLRDIHFNEFRNYLKIENSKVYIPVVFIQSNAINMSVSGEHSFDQHILYDLKINAGQAASNKLRKLDPLKRFKPARKSGWINLYYILSGTTSNVQYKQDQREVLSGFEQSASLKENLRNFLVEHFGYDVYWLEPNEWEDIPEYK